MRFRMGARTNGQALAHVLFSHCIIRRLSTESSLDDLAGGLLVLLALSRSWTEYTTPVVVGTLLFWLGLMRCLRDEDTQWHTVLLSRVQNVCYTVVYIHNTFPTQVSVQKLLEFQNSAHFTKSNCASAIL